MNSHNHMQVLRDLIVEMNLPGLDPQRIRPEAALRTDLGFDSLNLLILLVRIQERFGLEFGAAKVDPANFLTVQSLSVLIETLTAANTAGELG